jgi:hypothetical protein
MKVYPLEAIGQLELCNHLGANERGTTCQNKKGTETSVSGGNSGFERFNPFGYTSSSFLERGHPLFFSFPFGP